MNSTYRETGKNTISLSNLISFVHIKQRKVPDSLRSSPKRCLCPWSIITYTSCHHVITLTHIFPRQDGNSLLQQAMTCFTCEAVCVRDAKYRCQHYRNTIRTCFVFSFFNGSMIFLHMCRMFFNLKIHHHFLAVISLNIASRNRPA